jgi:hypothetical protein
MSSKVQITRKRTVANPNVEQLAEVIAMPTPIWKRKGNIFYAFSTIQDENGKRNVLELNMKGTVIKSFLWAGALSHTVVIDCSQQNIEELKSLIKTVSGFDGQHYRWPWDSGNKVKFTSKRDLDSEFQFVWNGAEVDWSNVEKRKKLTVDDVKEGATVVVEYTPLSYLGRTGTDGVDGFESGCSLQLLSIGVLSEGDSKEFDFDSPRKRKRMAY